MKFESSVVSCEAISVRAGDTVSIGITRIVRNAGSTRESVAEQTSDARLFISI